MQLVDRQTTRPAFAHWSQCIVEQTIKFIECHALAADEYPYATHSKRKYG